MSGMTQFWAYYDVNLHSVLYDVWSELEGDIPDYYQRESNPHITIHPRFQFRMGKEEKFRHYVHEIFPNSISVNIESFYYHPDEYKPMVICFDVETSIAFRKKQLELEEMINRNSGKNVLDTAPPHITICKSRDTESNGTRKVPSNVNLIKTRCKKATNGSLPITVEDTSLVIERGG
jgi:2'-5' RNA ligase